MIGSQVKNMVSKWTTYADHIDDPFFNFMIFYMCLDALMASGSKQFNESQKRKWLKEVSPELLNGWPAFCLESPHYANLIPMDGVLNMREPFNKENTLKLEETSSLDECVEYIYRIRCNLFHGEKAPIERRDLELVSNTWPILKHWVLSLLETS